MSKNYVTKAGDTFDKISRQEYGTENESLTIASANPGVNEPLSAGLNLIIPDLPSAVKNNQQKQAEADNISEVALLVDGVRFRFWEKIKISLSIDSIDTVEFSTPSNSDSRVFRDTFRPFTYKPVSIQVNGVELFNGTLVAVNPELESDRKTVTVACYSLPGSLNDCSAPPSSYPVEFKNLGLKDIAEKLAQPFGVGVKFHVEQGATFDRVNLKPSQTIMGFLSDLAKQRNIIISNTQSGELLFDRSIAAGKPVAKLEQGKAPLMSVTASFGAQQYYSHLTGIIPATAGQGGAKHTIQNKKLTGVLRPVTFSVPYTKNGDVEAAVNSRAGRMFGNMVSYNVVLPTWHDANGKLWQPNTTIILNAKDAMIYGDYEFIIRSVTLDRDEKGELTNLMLILPGSFEGKIPESLPWDE